MNVSFRKVAFSLKWLEGWLLIITLPYNDFGKLFFYTGILVREDVVADARSRKSDSNLDIYCINPYKVKMLQHTLVLRALSGVAIIVFNDR